MGRSGLDANAQDEGRSATTPSGVRGKSFVFTGKLSSMTHREARERVRAEGGYTPSTVSAGLSHLVVGSDGWPLRESGRLSNHLRRALEVGPSVEILTEAKFLAMLGLAPPAMGLYAPHQVTGALGIPREQIHLWERLGVLRPAQVVEGISYYGFQELVSLRTLSRLLDEGASPEGIRQSLQRLKGALDVSEPLRHLRLLAGQGGYLRARRDDRTYEYDGQLVFEFARAAGPTPETASVQTPGSSAEEWTEKAAALEERGREGEAAAAYREALRADPANTPALKGLATLRHAEGQLAEAAALAERAVEADPADPYAWYGLGRIHQDSSRAWKAVECYARALEALPGLPEVHFAMGEAYLSMGLLREAVQCWSRFLEQGAESPLVPSVRRRVKRLERRLMGRGR